MTLYRNIPNLLSLCRMAAVLPFLVVIHDIIAYGCTKNAYLIALFFLILLSDVFDGYLARKLQCVSSLGAKLDIISDSLYTILTLSVFAYFALTPIWFVGIIVLKLGEFILTSSIIGRKRQSGAGPVFDTIGKLGIILAMLLPGIFVFRCVITDYKNVMLAIVYIITAMLAVSSVSRIARAIKSN